MKTTDDLLVDYDFKTHEQLDRAIPNASPKLHEALDRYLEEAGIKPLPVKAKKKTRVQAIQELEAKPKLTARQRKSLKNLRIKQRREARKMKRVEKKLRRRR